MITQFANPARFEGFARVASPIAFWVMTLSLAAGTVWGLFIAPMDAEMGDGYRLIYVHPPAAYLAMQTYGVIAVASLIGFVWRHPLADIAARVSAPIGAMFCVLALGTGMLWGKPMWGTYWEWSDPKLVSVLVLLLTYLALIAIWVSTDDPQRAARLAGIAALIGVVNIPIIHFSVYWWNSLHQAGTLLRSGGPRAPASMIWPMLIMMVGFVALYVWLLLTRMRAAIDMKKAEGLERRSLGAKPSRARLEDAAPAGGNPAGGVANG